MKKLVFVLMISVMIVGCAGKGESASKNKPQASQSEQTIVSVLPSPER